MKQKLAKLLGVLALSSSALIAQTQTKQVGGGGSLPPQEGNAGKFLSTDGDQAAWQTVSSSGGTVTEVDTGTGLSGGPITTTGTVRLADTAVTPDTYGPLRATVDQQGRITSATNFSVTANRAIVSDDVGVPIASTTTDDEIGYLSGVTGPLQGQIDAKQPLASNLTALSIFNTNGFLAQIATSTYAGRTMSAGPGINITNGNGVSGNPTFTLANTAVTPGTYNPAAVTVDAQGRITNATTATVDVATDVTGVLPIANGGTNSATTLSNNRVVVSSGGKLVEKSAITANKALVSDVNGLPVASATTDTELGYVAGVTSAIQTQLGGKQPLDATLTALAAYNTDGLLTQTGADTFVGRSVAAGTGISVTNGNGVAGNPTINVADTAVTPGAYTYASITVDQQGRLTSASSGSAPAGGTVTEVDTGTGLSGGPITTTGTVRLADTAVTIGSYGTASSVGAFTVDQQGRLTSAANTPIVVTSAAVSDFNEAAEDAVGGILTDTATVDFTYSDAANTITADVKDGSITYAKIQNVSGTDKVLGRSSSGAGSVEEIPCGSFCRSIMAGTTASGVRSTLGAAATGAVGSSGITMTTNRILGRTTATTGAVEELSTATGLQLTAGTIAPANDLAAVEALSTSGIAVRTGSETWTTRSIAVSGSALSVTNGDGVSANPTITTDSDVNAIASLATTGLIARTGTGTASTRTITAGTGITVTNGDGVSGNPTIAQDTSTGSPYVGSGIVVGSSATQTGTITIGTGATFVQIEALAPGGGGGAGMRGATSTNRFGGNGGNGGAYASSVYRVADLGVSTLYYSLGKFGAGAIGQTTNTTIGATGGSAEDITIQKTSSGGQFIFFAAGGVGGLGGTTAALAQSTPSGNGGQEPGGIGGTSQTGSTASGVGSTYHAGQGGGCGQSISSGNANSTGALSGGTGYYHSTSSTFTSQANTPYSPGPGASGGAVATTGNSASTGGFSNVYGAGGGGGGGSTNGTASGGGGDGSPGIIRVTWW